ncbi:hypothetical protein [Ruegeria meonggei]|uniref:Uncharacterized protein n=1 Tax=Ruegeria meonggei TaxID=1446476 RepID=A0A1X6Z148_9RHOB|nr:hypothetical protein [Ruegeria meonggei]SLN37665.1 hypothetical protein RUM8411_01638 [Ruegeria meonggei]
MNFQGQELISRATYVSNRSLFALAFAKILSVRLDVNLEEFKLLGVSFETAQIEAATNFMLVFLALNHLLSWYGDFQSFQKWNHPKKMVSNMSFFSDKNETVSELEFYILQIESYLKQLKELRENPDENPTRDLGERSAELINSARELQASKDALTVHAKLYLWVWFLALPAAATAYALWL